MSDSGENMTCMICGTIYLVKSKWDAIRAHSLGWYKSKNELFIYCPEHVPEVIRKWRESKGE